MDEKRHVGLNDSNAADLTQQTFFDLFEICAVDARPFGGEILVV
jgi:hypothetical protein